jgi:hypothetical protein
MLRRFRIRQLTNEKWVAETRYLGFLWWMGISRSILGGEVILWSPLGSNFGYCFCDGPSEATKVLNEYKATKGI